MDARKAGGRWLLRVEDIDPPREHAGAADMILGALERYGFEWDGEVTYQSSNRARHEALIDDLLLRREAYACSCSRRDLAHLPSSPLGRIYPGTCRDGHSRGETAVRVRTNGDPIIFEDRAQGRQAHRLEKESGDFVIRRKDGLIAYHLAVAVDDADEGITHVVRGIDLMPSTARQIHLQQLLGLATPTYAHVPVVVYEDGMKLSKTTGAKAVPEDEVRPTLIATLAALNLAPPNGLADSSVADIWAWAIPRWDIAAVRGCPDIALQHYC